jgi:hypothetical protein
VADALHTRFDLLSAAADRADTLAAIVVHRVVARGVWAAFAFACFCRTDVDPGQRPSRLTDLTGATLSLAVPAGRWSVLAGLPPGRSTPLIPVPLIPCSCQPSIRPGPPVSRGSPSAPSLRLRRGLTLARLYARVELPVGRAWGVVHPGFRVGARTSPVRARMRASSGTTPPPRHWRVDSRRQLGMPRALEHLRAGRVRVSMFLAFSPGPGMRFTDPALVRGGSASSHRGPAPPALPLRRTPSGPEFDRLLELLPGFPRAERSPDTGVVGPSRRHTLLQRPARQRPRKGRADLLSKPPPRLISGPPAGFPFPQATRHPLC